MRLWAIAKTLSLVLIAFCAMSVPIFGRDSIPPGEPLKVRLEFRIEPAEFSALRDLLTQFAEAEHLTYNDLGAQMPPFKGRRVFDVELNQRNAVKITFTNIREETRMFVWFYEFEKESDLGKLEAKLESILRARWPNLQPYDEG